MKKRDLNIINDLHRFRCMTRDDIIALHFSGLKNPVTCCNTVLKRLRRDGQIEANTRQQPYIYFPSPSTIKKDSSKIPHFLKILSFYIEVSNLEPPKRFLVEPNYGKSKGFMTPDIFMTWKRTPFFVEVQRSVYSQKVMEEKMKRYEVYFESEEWKSEPWQPKNVKVFPLVLFVSDTRYAFPPLPFKVVQVQSVRDLREVFAKMFEERKLDVSVKNSNIKMLSL